MDPTYKIVIQTIDVPSAGTEKNCWIISRVAFDFRRYGAYVRSLYCIHTIRDNWNLAAVPVIFACIASKRIVCIVSEISLKLAQVTRGHYWFYMIDRWSTHNKPISESMMAHLTDEHHQALINTLPGWWIMIINCLYSRQVTSVSV